jgi:hypothetical protein
VLLPLGTESEQPARIFLFTECGLTEAQKFIKALTTELGLENPEKFAKKNKRDIEFDPNSAVLRASDTQSLVSM